MLRRARAAGAGRGRAPEAAAALAVHAGADADRRAARAGARHRARQPADLPASGDTPRRSCSTVRCSMSCRSCATRCFAASLDDVFRTGIPHVGKETPARFDRGRAGRPRPVYFNFVYSPFRNIEGDIEGIFVIASDVTEQVWRGNQVNDLREAAEAANRAKDEFLAMLGHELRNPLSPILTALQLMKLRGGDGIRARAHRHRAPGQSPDAARRRPARRLAHRARQGRAQGGDRRDGRGGREGDRDGQPAARAADAHAGRRRAAARPRGARATRRASARSSRTC